jgi:CubicO group peptidase (beta-lactamase class C family)
MKPLHALAACLVIGAQAPGDGASAAGRGDFAHGLRRSVSVAGQEDRRFHLAERMAHYRVPGVSVAVVQNCRIVELRQFGYSAPGRPVTRRTLFQAGSISKTFTAMAALRLVERNRLSLDGDVRQRLTSWRLPDSPLLAGRRVTLRGLLSHTAGINQEGGTGYPRNVRLPTLLEILEGRPPANTAPIRVETAPGTAWRYSGGGYYIAQAVMEDSTGTRYPRLMRQLIFGPLGLRDSTFSQPLDQSRMARAALAAGPDGSPLDGGWRVNPELAAGGLWTTPDNVARLAVAVTRAVRGEGRFLAPALAREAMVRGPGNWGLGVDLGPVGQPRRFGHTGHNVGYSSEFIMYPDTCQGAVVMTNADQGGWLVSEILRALADTYGWPDRRPSTVQAAIPLTPSIAERFVGTYRLRDFPAERFTISRRAGGLYWARAGHVGRDLLPETEGRLFSPDSRMTLEAPDPNVARAAMLSLSFGGGRNIAERVGD